jgi:hypothetical protein
MTVKDDLANIHGQAIARQCSAHSQIFMAGLYNSQNSVINFAVVLSKMAAICRSNLTDGPEMDFRIQLMP